MLIKTILCYGVVFATLTFTPYIDLTGIKCVVEGDRAAVNSAAVDYKDAKVYLCSEHCADAFKEDTYLAKDAKFSIKANHQLVLTGQYIQKACPLSGDPLDESFSSTVAGVKIGFSCIESQMQIDKLSNIEEKVELLFSDSAFKRAFVRANTEVMANAEVNGEQPDAEQPDAEQATVKQANAKPENIKK